MSAAVAVLMPAETAPAPTLLPDRAADPPASAPAPLTDAPASTAAPNADLNSPPTPAKAEPMAALQIAPASDSPAAAGTTIVEQTPWGTRRKSSSANNTPTPKPTLSRQTSREAGEALQPSAPATPDGVYVTRSAPGSGISGTFASITAMEAARAAKIAAEQAAVLAAREEQAHKAETSKSSRRGSFDAFEQARLERQRAEEEQRKREQGAVFRSARSRRGSSAELHTPTSGASTPQRSRASSGPTSSSVGDAPLATADPRANAVMSPVAEINEATSPVPDAARGSGAFDAMHDQSVASLARAEEEQRRRRAEEAAAEERQKLAWQAEILARQARTQELLQEAMAKAEAEKRAQAEAIEAERVAAARKKAEATLRFEEERKLRAMTPEQREAYLAEKERQRLAKIAEEEAKRRAEEEAREAEARRLREEAEAAARALLQQIVQQVEESHASPLQATPQQQPAAELTPASSGSNASSSAPNSNNPPSPVSSSLQQGGGGHGGTNDVSVAGTASTRVGGVDPSRSGGEQQQQLQGQQSSQSPETLNTDAAPEKGFESKKELQSTAPRKKRSSAWFCCGSAIDEPDEVPPQARPAASQPAAATCA